MTKQKYKLPSIPVLMLSLALGWASLILASAIFIICWRLTLVPATYIADQVIKAEEENGK